jgi:hypothetical protein
MLYTNFLIISFIPRFAGQIEGFAQQIEVWRSFSSEGKFPNVVVPDVELMAFLSPELKSCIWLVRNSYLWSHVEVVSSFVDHLWLGFKNFALLKFWMSELAPLAVGLPCPHLKTQKWWIICNQPLIWLCLIIKDKVDMYAACDHVPHKQNNSI